MLTGMSWESFATIRNLRGPVTETLITPVTPLSTARNVLVRRFLRDTTCDYLMWLAGDMVYDPMSLENLLATMNANPQAGCVVGVYFHRNFPYRALLFEKLGRPYISYPKDRPFKVHSAGLDCSLWRREVFEKMETLSGNYFRFTERESEDIAIADSLPAGFEMWCDPRVQAGHLSKVVINERWSANAKWAVDMLGLDDLPLQPIADEPEKKSPPVRVVKSADGSQDKA